MYISIYYSIAAVLSTESRIKQENIIFRNMEKLCSRLCFPIDRISGKSIFQQFIKKRYDKTVCHAGDIVDDRLDIDFPRLQVSVYFFALHRYILQFFFRNTGYPSFCFYPLLRTRKRYPYSLTLLHARIEPFPIANSLIIPISVTWILRVYGIRIT